MPNRQHKRVCAKCGKRHVKPTGRKCKMSSQSSPVSTAPSASGSMNEAQSAMALTSVATSTTVTATTSFCTLGTTTVTTTVSSAGSGGSIVMSMVGPSTHGQHGVGLARPRSSAPGARPATRPSLPACPTRCHPNGRSPYDARAAVSRPIHPPSPPPHRPNGRGAHDTSSAPADLTSSADGHGRSNTCPRCSPIGSSLTSGSTSSAWAGLPGRLRWQFVGFRWPITTKDTR